MEEGSIEGKTGIEEEDNNLPVVEPEDKQLTAFKEAFNFECDEIVSVVNGSDEFFLRARVIFKNTYELSIVSGPYAYGNSEQFEIAVLDPAGEFATEEVLGVNNCVVGHLSVEEIADVIKIVGEWKPRIEAEAQAIIIEAKQN